MSEDDESAFKFEPILEAPPNPESPNSGIGLFEEDSMAILVSKFSVVESLLRSTVKNQPFQDFMREILLAMMKVVKSEAGSILEVDYKSQTFFFRSVVGTSSDRVANFTIPMGQGIVGHVAESRRPLIVSNVNENRIHLKAIQEAVGFETRNLIALPLLVRGKIFGVLELLNRVGELEYSQSDVELLTYSCEMAAKAIEARLLIAWGTRRRATNATPGKAEAA